MECILGFHEAMANAMILSFYNPVHLHKMELFHNNTDTYELNMNYLMTIGLKKIAYAPFAYLVDQVCYNQCINDNAKAIENVYSLFC